jgi:hypothetical protein
MGVTDGLEAMIQPLRNNVSPPPSRTRLRLRCGKTANSLRADCPSS